MKSPIRIIVVFLVARAIVVVLSQNSDNAKASLQERSGETSSAAGQMEFPPYSCGPTFFGGGCSLR